MRKGHGTENSDLVLLMAISTGLVKFEVSEKKSSSKKLTAFSKLNSLLLKISAVAEFCVSIFPLLSEIKIFIIFWVLSDEKGFTVDHYQWQVWHPL